MKDSALKAWHERNGARFEDWRGAAVIVDYGRWEAEYEFLRRTVGVIDLSARSRLCLTGLDRQRFLHGQVTNDIQRLKPGEGCYAALITAKGKMQSDLNVFCLADELLLDFEPGLTTLVTNRFEKYVIADDVQIVDVSEPYGLISVQGPAAAAALSQLRLLPELPGAPFQIAKAVRPDFDELYVANHRRYGVEGFDLFAPAQVLENLWAQVLDAAAVEGGGPAGCRATEVVRIEHGLPRYGQDLDESNLPLEAGIEGRAISFKKGCYIGQEIISRIRTYGQVTKALRGLRFSDTLTNLPARGQKLYSGEQEVGYVTSACRSTSLKAVIGLGYVRKEANQVGNRLKLTLDGQASEAQIVDLPFNPSLQPLDVPEIAKKTI